MSDGIPKYLSNIRDKLQDQFQGLKELLAERNHFSFQQAASEHHELVSESLRVLQEYLESTLKDLFRIIDHISVLVGDYGQDLETFLEDLDSTLQDVQRCIEEALLLVKQHGQTIQDPSVTSLNINYLIQ